MSFSRPPRKKRDCGVGFQSGGFHATHLGFTVRGAHCLSLQTGIVLVDVWEVDGHHAVGYLSRYRSQLPRDDDCASKWTKKLAALACHLRSEEKRRCGVRGRREGIGVRGGYSSRRNGGLGAMNFRAFSCKCACVRVCACTFWGRGIAREGTSSSFDTTSPNLSRTALRLSFCFLCVPASASNPSAHRT